MISTLTGVSVLLLVFRAIKSHIFDQVTHNFAGILLCRLFLGVPEVGLHHLQLMLLYLNFSRRHSRRFIPVHFTCCRDGTLAGYVGNKYSHHVIYQLYKQELAFRSALLYGGLLFSNAFGSVSKRQGSISYSRDSSDSQWSYS